MHWLKDVVLDIIVTVFVIVTALMASPVLKGILWGYTALMILIKGITLFKNTSFSQLAQKAKTSAPEWFSHLLYAINTATLLMVRWWYLGVAWALIWLFSFIAQRRLKKISS